MNRGNVAPPERISAMFDGIAGVYDPMNLLLSGFQEPRWRRAAVRATGVGPGDRVLDVACGTGTLTLSLARAIEPGGSVVGIDRSRGMLERARGRAADRPGIELLRADALHLPFADASFDAAAIAFGMRNLADYGRGFQEMARVVRPGGCVVCLEIARPVSRIGRLAAAWFDLVAPLSGRIVGHGSAYAYLICSTKAYPAPDEVAGIMREAGLERVTWWGLSGGIVTLHVGRRAQP